MQSGDGTEAVYAVPALRRRQKQPGVQLPWDTQNSAQSPCEVEDQGQSLLKNHRMREGRKYNFQLLLGAKAYRMLYTWGGRGY